MHELLVFTPATGEFDAARIGAFLESLPFSFRDGSSGPWLLCGNAGAAHISRLQLEEADAGYPYVCLVTVRPAEVRLSQLCAEDALEQAREVAEWLLANYSCRIADSDGADITPLAAGGVAALYPK